MLLSTTIQIHGNSFENLTQTIICLLLKCFDIIFISKGFIDICVIFILNKFLLKPYFKPSACSLSFYEYLITSSYTAQNINYILIVLFSKFICSHHLNVQFHLPPGNVPLYHKHIHVNILKGI